jgi:hypothetical protein
MEELLRKLIEKINGNTEEQKIATIFDEISENILDLGLSFDIYELSKTGHLLNEAVKQIVISEPTGVQNIRRAQYAGQIKGLAIITLAVHNRLNSID